MLIDATLILSLLGSCQSSIEPQTLYKLVQIESAGNPFSITTEVPIAQQPTTKDEAIEYAKSLTNLGISYKVGLMQVPISEHGLTISTAFDSCANIKAGANKFKTCLDQATTSFPDSSSNEQVEAAASCYHYGNFEDGFKKEESQNNSYAERFRGATQTIQHKPKRPRLNPRLGTYLKTLTIKKETIMKKSIEKKSVAPVTLAAMLLLTLSGTATAAGGLDPLINETEALKDTLYMFLGVASFVYLMYHVIMAKMGKQDWSDVGMALAKVAGAGGILAAGTFAWGMFA